MFNLCSDVFCQLDLPINVDKCHCLRIGPRFYIKCSPLSIQGVDVEWVKSKKFLGVTLCQAKTFNCDWVEPKNKFHCNCNVIFGRLSAYCVILLYVLPWFGEIKNIYIS